MNPMSIDRLSQLLCYAIGIIIGLLAAILLGGWLTRGELFWPGLITVGVMLFVQQRMVRKGRRMMDQEEANALERLVDMKREVDKTARRYRALLEGAGNAIFIFNADTNRLQEVNRKGSELFGYSKEEMLQLTGKELTPAPERRRFSDLIRRVRRRGRGRVDSLTFCGKDGVQFLGEVEARLIDLDDENVVHVTVRDITYRTRVEKEIRQRNRELSILNSIIARANESIQLDKVLAAVLNETIEAFGAEAGMIHLCQDDKARMTLEVHHNLDSTMLQLVEHCGCHSPDRLCCHALPSGPLKGCQISLAAGEGGSWRTMIGIPLLAKQITGVLHILSTAERTYSQEELRFLGTVGHQIGMVIAHARIFAELTWKTDELLRSYSLLEKNSRQLAVSQRRLKTNLAIVERANKDLERLDRMKSHFLGIVSHEFKTPLTSIIGGTQFLMAGNREWTAEEQKLLDIISEGGERLNDIVSNLLKVARLESKSFSLSKAPIDLGNLFQDIQATFLPSLEERGQHLAFSNMESVPAFSADREYLEEVFSQLLENAIKFSRDGGEITVRAELTDRSLLEQKRAILDLFNDNFLNLAGPASFILVEISDSGVGIHEDDHLHIFDKFYGSGDIRHHSSGRSKFLGKGPGLGLSIVKGMVEAHGGMVWVESPGQNETGSPGSTFFVLLPTEEAEVQPVLPFMQLTLNAETKDEENPPLLP